jgi:hypothetical protein
MRQLRRAAGLVTAAVLAGACSNSSVLEPSQNTELRFFNLSPDAPALDVAIDGVVALRALGSGQVAPTINVAPGSRTIQMRLANTSTVALQATETLVGATQQSFLAVGPFASIEPLFITDDNTLAATGKTRIRFLNVSPSAGPVDIYLTASGADLTGVTAIVQELAFKGVSAYVETAPGVYDVQVTTAGTTTVLVKQADVKYLDQEVHSTFVLDKAGGGAPPTVAVLLENAPPAPPPPPTRRGRL